MLTFWPWARSELNFLQVPVGSHRFAFILAAEREPSGLFSFLGSAWERTVLEALPRFAIYRQSLHCFGFQGKALE